MPKKFSSITVSLKTWERLSKLRRSNKPPITRGCRKMEPYRNVVKRAIDALERKEQQELRFKPLNPHIN